MLDKVKAEAGRAAPAATAAAASRNDGLSEPAPYPNAETPKTQADYYALLPSKRPVVPEEGTERPLNHYRRSKQPDKMPYAHPEPARGAAFLRQEAGHVGVDERHL